jgi:hypothetical protein
MESMNLENFELFYSQEVLEKAILLHKNFLVEEIERVDKNEYATTINDIPPAHVILQLKGLNIAKTSCDCGMDMDCPHVAAMLYEMEYLFQNQKLFELENLELSQYFKEFIESIDNEKINNFLINTLKRNTRLRQQFLEEFGWMNFGDSEK